MYAMKAFHGLRTTSPEESSSCTLIPSHPEELAITSGVPQGSILGPLLFIVYINDLPRCVKHCSVNMYADDTVLYLAGPTVKNLNFHINQDLQCLSEWLEDSNLVLNVSKTKCVLFTSQRQAL